MKALINYLKAIVLIKVRPMIVMRVLSLLTLLNPPCLYAQSTSWIGGTDDDWRTASNWTSGVPDQTIDVIIGDVSFTGPFEPRIRATANCKSITIGDNGEKLVNYLMG